MVGKSLGLIFHSVCELFFKHRGNARVERLPWIAQQGAIGRVLDQML
jgi:hypothetical protein